MIKKKKKIQTAYLLYSFSSNELSDLAGNERNVEIIGLYNDIRNGERALMNEIESRCIKGREDNNWFYKEREDLISSKVIQFIEVFYDYIGNYEDCYYLILEKTETKD